MTMGLIHKTFLVLKLFERALTCSILIEETQVMVRKAYFLRRGSWLRPESWTSNTDPKSWTVLLRPTHQWTNVLKFQPSRCFAGRKIAHIRTDGQTDGRHNDFSRTHFYSPHMKYGKYWFHFQKNIFHKFLRFRTFST
jgi:hypothetical protein